MLPTDEGAVVPDVHVILNWFSDLTRLGGGKS
jgi:hypothetical protein